MILCLHFCAGLPPLKVRVSETLDCLKVSHSFCGLKWWGEMIEAQARAGRVQVKAVIEEPLLEEGAWPSCWLDSFTDALILQQST